MKKGVLLLTSLFFLAGCALPLPLKVASWALDGISYLATNKSIAENGLSIIAKKDCSLMRPLKGEQFCIGNNYDIAQVLKNTLAPATVNDQGVQAQALATAKFEAAAGPRPKRLSPKRPSYNPSEFTDAWRFMRQRNARAEQTKPAEPERLSTAARKVSSRTRMRAVKAVARPIAATDATDAISAPGYDAGEDTAAWAFIQARNGDLAAEPQAGPPEETQQAEEGGSGASSPPKTSEVDTVNTVNTVNTEEPTPTPILTARATETGPDTKPSVGLYYVIGSLTRLINLDRLPQRQIDLKSLIVVAQVRNRPLYREVIGPFKMSEKQAVRRMIKNAGVTKAWLTFIDPHRWTLASPAEISVLPPGGAQTASLH